jgi:hypothetical protein
LILFFNKRGEIDFDPENPYHCFFAVVSKKSELREQILSAQDFKVTMSMINGNVTVKIKSSDLETSYEMDSFPQGKEELLNTNVRRLTI